MEMLLSKIFQKIQKDPHCYQAYEDLLAICRETMKTDIPLARKYLELLSDELEKLIPTIEDIGNMRKMFALHREVVFACARDSFHLCLLAVELRKLQRKLLPVSGATVQTERQRLLQQDMITPKYRKRSMNFFPGKRLKHRSPQRVWKSWRERSFEVNGDPANSVKLN